MLLLLLTFAWIFTVTDVAGLDVQVILRDGKSLLYTKSTCKWNRLTGFKVYPSSRSVVFAIKIVFDRYPLPSVDNPVPSVIHVSVRRRAHHFLLFNQNPKLFSSRNMCRRFSVEHRAFFLFHHLEKVLQRAWIVLIPFPQLCIKTL